MVPIRTGETCRIGLCIFGCLFFGHYFNFRVSTPNGKGNWKDYYCCGMCGKRKPIRNLNNEI